MGAVANAMGRVTPVAVMLLTMGAAAHASTEPKPPPVVVDETVLRWLVVMVIVVFVGTLIAVMMRLSASPGWSLVDALSEEGEVTEKDAAGNPVKVTKLLASSSRLIALVGLMGILALFIGSGITLLLQMGKGGDIKASADAYSNYLMYGVVMFAPYIVNKFSSVFDKFGPPRA